jgi:hypothetical protein
VGQSHNTPPRLIYGLLTDALSSNRLLYYKGWVLHKAWVVATLKKVAHCGGQGRYSLFVVRDSLLRIVVEEAREVEHA